MAYRFGKTRRFMIFFQEQAAKVGCLIESLERSLRNRLDIGRILLDKLRKAVPNY